MLWSLGLGEPYPVSALHGRGTGDMLDAVLAALPETRPSDLRTPPSAARAGWRSSAAQRRQVVAAQQAGRRGAGGRRRGGGHDPRPGRRAGRARGATWRFVDTAGIRAGRTIQEGTDYYASLRTRRPSRAEVAVVLARRQRAAHRAGPADHLDGRRGRPGAGHRLQQVGPARRGAPLLPRARDRARPGAGPVGAAGQHLGPHRAAQEKLVPALDTALECGTPGCRRAAQRLPRRAGGRHPHPVRGGKQPHPLRHAGRHAPPRFVLFASGFLEAGYHRFIERRLREEFGFVGSPIDLGAGGARAASAELPPTCGPGAAARPSPVDAHREIRPLRCAGSPQLDPMRPSSAGPHDPPYARLM